MSEPSKNPAIAIASSSDPMAPPISTNFGYVVFEVDGILGGRVVWAWCQSREGQPGFEDISFTLADGKTATTPGDGPLRLGRMLFRVWC